MLRICRRVCAAALVGLGGLSDAGEALTEDHKLSASDPTFQARFGSALAVSADHALVGAPSAVIDGVNDAGAVYVFDLSTGLYVTTLSADVPQNDGYFGTSIAVSGETLLVGSSGVNGTTGAAFVFDLTTGQQTAVLSASDGAALDGFGTEVALSDDIAVIAAPQHATNGEFHAGAAYVFDLTSGQEISKLTAADANERDYFGTSVAVSGGTALVGARLQDPVGLLNAGAAYLFDTATGMQLRKLTAPDGVSNDRLGISVALIGDTALVGSYLHDTDDGGSDAGAVYVFDASNGQMTAKLAASDGASVDRFGQAVAVSGDHAVVGATLADPGGVNGAGAAYLFDLGSMTETAKLIASDPVGNDFHGESVAIRGSDVLAGARGHDLDGLTDAGAAYLYRQVGVEPCIPDLAEPFGVLDLADIVAFVTLFTAMDGSVDFDGNGVFDLADIVSFVTAFGAGCP